VVDGVVYAALCDYYCYTGFDVSNPPGALGALDAATGAPRWSYKTRLSPLSPAAVGP